MPFYLRKSVRVGPLRFNLSKSGIGVSSGIPGLRIGTGPRGTYVHMGRGGLYYRQTLSSPTRGRTANPTAPQYELAADHTHGPMTEIGSGCVTEMVDTNSAALLAEIQQKRKRFTLWPISGIASLLIVIALIATNSSLLIIIPTAILGLILTFAIHQYDQLKKSVVLMYDLDGSSLQTFENLYSAIAELSQCGAVWHLTAKGDVYDPKYHAGAGALVNRKRINPSFKNPPYVKTNLSIPHLSFGNRSLYLLPGRMLFYALNGVGAVDYSTLEINFGSTRFIEEGPVPRDAAIVDQTWRYVNKNGSPDRRFNDNRQIPICEYEELNITSASGIQEVLQISRVGVSQRLSDVVNETAAEIHRARNTIQPIQATATNSNARDLAQHSSHKELHLAIFHLLCCVMVADGRASTSEKSAITEAMAINNSGWSTDDCNSRIDSFINKIKKHGHAAVVRAALSKISLVKKFGYEKMLMQSIKLVGVTDGNMGGHERRLRDKIRQMLQTEANDA